MITTDFFYQKIQQVITPKKMYRIAELLLQKGADPNQRHNNPHSDLKGYTTLMFCAEQDEADFFRLMLQHGGDSKQTCSYGPNKQHSVLQIAQNYQSKSIIKILADLASS